MTDKPKNLPVRAIAIGTAIVFVIVMGLFLVMPAFFDVHVTDALFETPSQPWMLPPEVQSRYEFTVQEMQGKYHYGQYCEACHGPFGNGQGRQSAGFGGRIPNLLAADAHTKLHNGIDQAGLEKTINEGIPGTGMPAFPQIAKHAKESIIAFLEYCLKNREKLLQEKL
jgi:mono/diheme cytochrome c family protein